MELQTKTINSPQDLLNFLQEKECSEFTSKNMAAWIKEDFGKPKAQTLKIIQELKELGIIERRSKSTICTSVCASCYEYGCDAGPSAPYNYWKILRWTI